MCSIRLSSFRDAALAARPDLQAALQPFSNRRRITSWPSRSGIFGLVNAFLTRTWRGFLLTFLSALFRGFVGYLLILKPLAGASASFFIVAGTFRGVGAAMLTWRRWGWAPFSGFISLALGITAPAQMPVSSLLVHRLRD